MCPHQRTFARYSDELVALWLPVVDRRDSKQPVGFICQRRRTWTGLPDSRVHRFVVDRLHQTDVRGGGSPIRSWSTPIPHYLPPSNGAKLATERMPHKNNTCKLDCFWITSWSTGKTNRPSLGFRPNSLELRVEGEMKVANLLFHRYNCHYSFNLSNYWIGFFSMIVFKT